MPEQQCSQMRVAAVLDRSSRRWRRNPVLLQIRIVGMYCSARGSEDRSADIVHAEVDVASCRTVCRYVLRLLEHALKPQGRF